MTRVWHYDGTSAIRHQCLFEAEGDGFRLRGEGGGDAHYRFAEIAYGGELGGKAFYTLKAQKGWRIGFEDAPPLDVAASLPVPEKYGRVIDRFGIGPASAVFLALSAAFVFVAIKAPDWLAPAVPMSWEKKLGDAMIGDMGGRLCHGPGSDAALKSMAQRLDPKGTPIDIQIANIGMVNAVALPGGRIVIFRGLLQEAKSPDELAGVLGHEMGHVRNRDVMGALMRQLGLSVVLGGASGSTSQAGDYVNVLVSSTYSREAEARADAHAIRLMREASVSAKDTAGFFARLAEVEKKLDKNGRALLGYMSSHPLSESREKAFKQSLVKDKTYTPVITPKEWMAILDSCRDDPKVEKDDGFLF